MADAPHAQGRTHVADRAVERIARRFAQEVDGVITWDAASAVVPVVTPNLPTIAVESAGDRRRLTVRIAVRWDHDARAVATEVQRSLRRRLAEATGSELDRVDVTVAALVGADAADAHRRRRVQ